MKRSPLRNASKKRLSQTEERKALRLSIIEAQGEACEVLRMRRAGVDVGSFGTPCASRGRGRLEAHERAPRSLWPGGHLVPSNVVALCPGHHDHVKVDTREAERLDLHRRAPRESARVARERELENLQSLLDIHRDRWQ